MKAQALLEPRWFRAVASGGPLGHRQSERQHEPEGGRQSGDLPPCSNAPASSCPRAS